MTSPDMPIAIVGMGCRFAGNVTGPERLWELLKSGQSGWSEIPESRFATSGILHPQKDKIGSTNVRGGYFLGTDPGAFDASFFNLSTEVASTLDPQIRMTLEVVFEAMESAGIKLPDIQGSDTSVFAGCMVRDYHDTLARDPHTLPRYFMTGNAATMAANRVSHFYDLRGPSMTIDTGCSTTLTALHLACRSLQAGESGSAIVTGANLMLNPDVFVSMSTIGFLSPDGISYSFDHRANGYGRGDGIAAVILKRLDHAVAAGDPIRAIIRGSALNQDGKTPTITTPSQEAQERLMGACYRSCGLDPGETGFVEAHGTGTPTGDPIEVTAIANIIASASPPGSDPLLLGSVKSAIGHTEAASGLASVIKVVCALEAGLVPPNANFEELNPKLRLEEWNMQVPTTVRPWPRRGATRRASINNFGFGGANAHVILEEYRPESMAGLLASCSGMASSVAVNGHSNVNGYPQVNEHDPTVTNGMKGENGLRGEEMSSALQHTKSNGHHVGAMPAPDSADGRVFVIYGKDQASCQSRVSDLRLYLSLRDNEEQPQVLHDLAYTLSEHRTVMPWMVACRSRDVPGLQEALESGKPAAARVPSQPPRLGIVFNGQGAQWHAMGRELIHRYDVFRASIEQMGVYIREMGATWSLLDELLRDEDTSNVQNFEYSLPLCSSVQIALVDLLRSWGIEPSAVTGHSSGEVAAAYAAGALDARSAIAIPYLRGALSAETDQIIGKGGMIAVGAGRQKVQEYIDRVRSGSIVVACVNSQNSITASGDLSAVRELEDMLVCDKVFCRRLRINGAFHSHHMAPISAKYMDQLRPVLKPRRGPRDVVFSSSMTGGLLQDLDVLSTSEYWNNNMLRAVEFEASFRAMCVGARTGQGGAEGSPSPAQQIDVVVELGPHGALGGPIQDMLSLPAFEGTQISYLTGLVRNKSAIETTHSLVCELLRKGWPVNLSAVNSPGTERRARVLSDLPTYPWNHSARFWMEPRANKAWRRQVEPSHDILGRYQSTSDPFVPTWRNVLRLSEMPWLGDHVVGSKVVFPAAGYISMVSEAAYRLAGRYLPDERVQELRLRNVEFLSALHVPEAEGQEVQLTVMRRSEGLSSWAGWLDFRVSSVSANNDWLLHCQGSFKLDTVSTAAEADHHHAADPKMPLKPLTVTRRVDPADLWTALANVGIRHGPAFRKISTVESTRENSVVTFQSTDPSSPHQGGDLLHPATLDSVFQAAYTVLQGLGSALESAFIPRAIKSMSLRRQGTLGPVFEAHLRPGRVGVQSFDTGVTVFAASPAGERNVNAVLHMDGLLYQSLDLDGASAPRSDRGSLCSTVTWAPDLSFASSMRAAVVSMKHTITSSEKEAMVDLQRAVLHYVHDAVRALTDQDVDRLARHHKKHHRWMLQLLQRAAQNELGPESSKWLQVSADDKAALLDRVAAANVNGEMISRLGPRAVALMKGEVAPLELMVEGELLYRYYVGALKWDRSTGQVARLVRLLAHKNPRATILEIGGGTGGGTQAILDALGRGSGGDDGQGALFERYDFTDISQGFFEAAQKRFEPWRDLMTFRKLDIEADAVAQGFEAGSYDIVVACQCLHATKAMDRTMSNVRRLLKPGGKLVLIETTRDALDVFMAFGFLPGWWLSEEPERVNSPSLTVPFWDQVLRRNGFSGLDMELRDCEDPDFFSFSAMVSTAQGDAYAPAYPQQVVLVCTAQRFPAPWLQALQSRLATVLGYEPPIKALELGSTTTTTFHGETCIYLEELLQPDLLDLDEDGFHGLKTMVTHCDGLLWLTRGAAMESSVPEASLSHGLLRTVRHEAPSKRYIALDVSAERAPCSEETMAAICEVFAATFDAAATTTTTTTTTTTPARRDWEFCERDGIIHVPRLFSMPPLGLGPEDDAAESELKPFLLGEKRIEAEVARGRGEGQPSILFTEEASESDAARGDMSDDHVEIRPRAFGLESRGPYPRPPRGGSRPVALASDEEHVSGCAGIIIRAGKLAADHGLGIGDRVCFLIAGSRWASSMRVHCAHVARIPEHVAFSAAARLAPGYVTVHLALQDVARTSSGERVLVHGSMAVMGRAAIEYGRVRGLVVYLAAEDEAEKKKLEDELGLAGGARRSSGTVLNRSEGFIVQQIWAATGQEGVDVIVSPSRSFVEQSSECLRDFGRVIELDGRVDADTNTNMVHVGCPAATATAVNGAFYRMRLGSWLVRRPWIVSQAMQASMLLLLLGSRPCVEEISISQSARVLDDKMNPPEHGREQALLALTVGDADVVPVARRPRHAALKADASYLLVGGAGGVGRSLCEWAIARGARHVVVVSRSARSDDEFLAELTGSCNVRVVKCDVSDQDQLAAARAASADMPPIRGIFQAAMVLKDAVFEQLSLDDFHAVLRPKVQGSRALLRQFPDLDFFILFSSVLGITGAPGQANYTAAGAYQDALASHARSRGVAVTTIDLSMLQSVGHVAGRRSISSRLARNGIVMLQEAEMHSILDHTLAAGGRGTDTPQVVTGIGHSSSRAAFDKGWVTDARFTALQKRESLASRHSHERAAAAAAAAASPEQSSSLREALPRDLGPQELARRILEALAKELRRMFSSADVDVSRDLTAHGVDSLVAVEIRNWLAAQTGIGLSVLDLIQAPSLTDLANCVAERIGGEQEPVV